MTRTTLGLLILSTLAAGCSSPEPTPMQVTSGDPTFPGSTGPGEESSGTTTTGTTGGDDTTGGDSAMQTSSSGTADDESSTGDEPGSTGSSSGGGTEGGSTGDACELGTQTDCLACGEACSAEGECTPQGCLEPITLGHPDAFDGLGGLDGFIWGFPVELDADATLTHLGFIAGGSGGHVELSVYSDAAGSPSTRITTAAPALGYSPGTHELPVPPQLLEAGTYWIMASASGPTRIAIDINGGAVNFPLQGRPHVFGDGHPDTLDDVSEFVNFRPNFYMRLEQLQ